MAEVEVPEDLGLKVVSKEREVWERILENSKKSLLQGRAEIEIAELVIKLAEDKCKSML